MLSGATLSVGWFVGWPFSNLSPFTVWNQSNHWMAISPAEQVAGASQPGVIPWLVCMHAPGNERQAHHQKENTHHHHQVRSSSRGSQSTIISEFAEIWCRLKISFQRITLIGWNTSALAKTKCSEKHLSNASESETLPSESGPLARTVRCNNCKITSMVFAHDRPCYKMIETRNTHLFMYMTTMPRYSQRYQAILHWQREIIQSRLWLLITRMIEDKEDSDKDHIDDFCIAGEYTQRTNEIEALSGSRRTLSEGRTSILWSLCGMVSRWVSPFSRAPFLRVFRCHVWGLSK